MTTPKEKPMTNIENIIERLDGYQEIPDMDAACQRDFADAAKALRKMQHALVTLRDLRINENDPIGQQAHMVIFLINPTLEGEL